ncbi:methylated-DNA--[protein]-cysteine S-methyltransferase [Brenneria corticis]|uniref:Methylated-DNA--protein-cysteine methyltransferase n=1 Tax=Brenneria corticis TaxID=2173106 RepID=A0A2U1U4D6_9GAMM|nr:methylated-DNA--[protein]-cysteine S-methyltransferase [Brenneria sp. CFCC 11842]PWC16444.1 methylated-DNA--protein-cysteine methyltransferase [Brenneria sp. CFCC 11842]
MKSQRFSLERMATPLGEMLMVVDEQRQLRALDWQDYEERLHTLLRRQYRGVQTLLQERPAGAELRQVMQAYFDGDLAAVDGLPVATGGTAFQRLVWRHLRDIPAGETVSYGALAARINNPLAVRAVGLANGANPVGIVVPCHRVIGANRSLTGYGGGLDRKRWLLEHERKWRRQGV